MTPKEQVEQLMNEGIPFVKQMLSEHGEFYPFGVALMADGKIRHVGAKGDSEHPRSQDLLDILFVALRDGAKDGKYKAIAVFIDVRVPRPTDGRKVDAVQVGLEHRDHYCADVFFPYTIAGSSVAFGEVFASKRVGVVYGCTQ